MFFKDLDRSKTKNEISEALKDMASNAGQPLSDARADKLANKFKKGKYDPELMRVIQYSDPTGETAVRNVLQVA